ncbi:MAG: M23 family metallopeptidase [Spirochaetales bacterium]|nr:M23 family metallopeptidase [Spirochaetales bacterium]
MKRRFAGLKTQTLLYILAVLVCFQGRIDLHAGEQEFLLIKVFPLAGVLGTDLRSINSHYDHDPEKATEFSALGFGNNHIKDYMGGDRTYDGHMGTDISIYSFEVQDIGVPIVAVLKGTVLEVHDGEYDKQLKKSDLTGNYVVIDHGSGTQSYYNHLKKGSVCVKPGQVVKEGEQVGLLGSSGNSTWPHLHFEWRENEKSVDPFSGPVNPIESRWAVQPGYDFPMTIVDWGLTYKSEMAQPPYISPREPAVLRGKSKADDLKLWIQVLNVPDRTYKRTWSLYSPGGKKINEWEDTIDGSRQWHGLGAAQWLYTYSMSFSEKSGKGKWKMVISHDGRVAKELLIDVLDKYGKNRPPSPPPGVVLFPEYPRPGDCVSCTVAVSNTNLDPDLDKERFRFEWIVNGKKMRDVTNASRLDYLPANTTGAGDTLICRVYTSDGKLESEPVEIKTKVGK